MFITLSIYSKNSNSLTNFLKFFYKLETNKVLNLKFFPVQSQKNKKVFFFSVLQSPHVNKKSQEQFGYYVYNKQLKIHLSQMAKFLVIWKKVKMKLFSDVKIKTKFWLDTKFFRSALFNKTDSDRFVLKFLQKSELNELELDKLKRVAFNQPFFSNKTGRAFLKLLDAHGEVMLKKVNFYDFKNP
uniref:ribosomal protein S10 n=1 Tax=Skeletonema pseudocostatum TaxID=41457 RepID=UPI001D1102B8|nr:ribosomal protein S10 [Skeletonema pseudocostatum]UBA16176.1 ribosomal protein S10 [Skeletonema pseudocostatum]